METNAGQTTTTVVPAHLPPSAAGGAFVPTTSVFVINPKMPRKNTLAVSVSAATLTAHKTMADSVQAEVSVSVDNVFAMKAGLERPVLVQWTLLPAWLITR